MVSLAHCHRKRGSSRAERAHVKSARRIAKGRGHVEVCVSGLKLEYLDDVILSHLKVRHYHCQH